MSSNQSAVKSETERLEGLWSGEFGNQYVERNAGVWQNRQPFWDGILSEFPVKNIFEVGCNVGGNLRCIAEIVGAENVFGIDVNTKALEQIHQEAPKINAIHSFARELPFRDNWFDMVFTMGVLIHQPESTLPLVMSEIVRCSRRYVFCGEYFAEETAEVSYRGQEGALFKRDYGFLYQELFPNLKLLKKGFLEKGSGFDDVTYWMFEKNN
jgi:pseudaminic acid biosynthesis-associated methylase